MRAENATKKVDVNNWTVGMKVDFDKETSEFIVTNAKSGISTRISYALVVTKKFSSFNDFFAYFKKRKKATDSVETFFTREAIEVIDDVIKHNKRMTTYYQHLEAVKNEHSARKED